MDGDIGSRRAVATAARGRDCYGGREARRAWLLARRFAAAQRAPMSVRLLRQLRAWPTNTLWCQSSLTVVPRLLMLNASVFDRRRRSIDNALVTWPGEIPVRKRCEYRTNEWELSFQDIIVKHLLTYSLTQLLRACCRCRQHRWCQHRLHRWSCRYSEKCFRNGGQPWRCCDVILLVAVYTNHVMHAETLTSSTMLRSSRSDRSCSAAAMTAAASAGGGAIGTDFRFRKAVCRVLIALSFKSFRRRNERYRRRERSDCSEARILPVVEEERPSEQGDLDYISVRRLVGGCQLWSVFDVHANAALKLLTTKLRRMQWIARFIDISIFRTITNRVHIYVLYFMAQRCPYLDIKLSFTSEISCMSYAVISL